MINSERFDIYKSKINNEDKEQEVKEDIEFDSKYAKFLKLIWLKTKKDLTNNLSNE